MLVAPGNHGTRVAVTGFGVVGPCGIGRDAFWAGLLREPAEGRERHVEGFDASHLWGEKELRRVDRFTQMGVAAAVEALEQAGDLQADPGRIGTIVGTGVGGLATLEEQIINGHEKGLKRVSPFLVPMMMNNAAAAGISMRFGFQGPCETVVTACAAGTHSVTDGARLVASGRCDVVITGSSEAPLTPTGIAAFSNMTAMTKLGHSRPFDARRDGFVIAEGAGILVLEAWDHAVARGATIYAEVLGGASTADAHHITAPSPGGHGAVTCMQLALEDAGITAADVRHINAHGTSTPLNDAAEAEAVAKVFGTDGGPVVTSTKGVTGHALGGAGALEAVAAILTMQHRLIPPTMGTEAVDPELAQIDLVLGEPRPWEPGITLSNSFGFGGHNGTVVLAPGPGLG
jgi:3-oxoacyl-[acyl-carrier-protein] synthase II